MFPAAQRLAALGALTLLSVASAQTATSAAAGERPPPPAAALGKVEGPVRAVPSRPMLPPALPTGLRLGNIDYASATDVAVWLGLKGTWTEPLRRLTLTEKENPGRRIEFNVDSRDTTVNGLRVFLGSPTVLHDGKLYLSRVDAERCLAPLLRPGLGVELPPAPKIIVIDPGHGGEDPGTENKALGLTEKILTLDVAQRLKKVLEAAGFKVVLTRSRDVAFSPVKTVDLALRADFANREHADLFVSIHFNAAAKDTRGTEVFSYAPRTQRSTDSWGAHVDDSVADDAAANRLDHWNAAFAAALDRGLLQALKTEDRGKKIAHWAVLRTLACPGALVEPAIITNDAEAHRVAVPAFRQKIAEGIAAGIINYADLLDALRPKPSPSPAGSPSK